MELNAIKQIMAEIREEIQTLFKEIERRERAITACKKERLTESIYCLEGLTLNAGWRFFAPLESVSCGAKLYQEAIDKILSTDLGDPWHLENGKINASQFRVVKYQAARIGERATFRIMQSDLDLRQENPRLPNTPSQC